ncbi:hypothetical protein VTK26DRAFT_4664 [Humicola hyalothermophila]
MSLSASNTGGQGGLSGQTTGQNAPALPPMPVETLSQLSLGETSNNPWQPALDVKKDMAEPTSVPRFPDQDAVRDNVWASARPSRQATPGPQSNSPALLSLPSEDGSAGWEEDLNKSSTPLPFVTAANAQSEEDAHAWEELRTLNKGKGVAQPPAAPGKAPAAPSDDWNLIDLETHPGPPSKQSTWENFDDDDSNAAKTAREREQQTEAQTETPAPELPPRSAEPSSPPPPPRPVDENETYQIKKINWFDATAAENPRTSPILVQNANGPCPLVALVNALVLTTPADKLNTALVEALRTREQVSLGLLLDAVFDELMSERRNQPDVPLPDMTELYGFLKGLHTGMNVNPRFIPAPEVVTAFKRASLTHLNPTEHIDMIPGTFEHTKEMALYSTFSIPLIHGWIPSKDDVVYDAFARQAASYEDAQNILFREEELEEKLSSSDGQGLTEEEQQVYQDILIIKSFLSISATQLTRFGLDVIRKSMKPGSVAILFRNDHFSTLYRHPQTLQLFTLVTDAGYAGHAEVVWESLVDVNGESAEFFSGDFRLVSHGQDGSSGGQVSGAADNNDGWTTVQNRRSRNQPSRRADPSQPPLSPAHEQEDRDLALALQLQEEEDERHRAAQERRRREGLLSEQFIEQQARSGTHSRGGSGGGRGGRGGGGHPANRAASHSTTSLPLSARRASSSTTSVHATGTMAGGNRNPAASFNNNNNNTQNPATAGSRPATQTVRSLLPPRSGEDAEDVPPPSYEQAAKQLPYVPPAGHPSHPASSPNPGAAGGRGRGSGPEYGGGVGMRRGSGASAGRGGGRVNGAGSGSGSGSPYPPGQYYPAGHPGAGGGGYRRGVPPPAAAAAGSGGSGGGGPGKDRDCVVM